MFFVHTSKGAYVVYGFDVYNDAAARAFGLDYRVGIERTRVSELLILQNPILYLLPFAFEYRDYVQRISELLRAMSQAISGKSDETTLRTTIWEFLDALIFRNTSHRSQEIIGEKLRLFIKTIKRDISRARELFNIEQHIIIRYDIIDLLESIFSKFENYFPAFLLDVNNLQITDGVTNSVTVLQLERQIEERIREAVTRIQTLRFAAQLPAILRAALGSAAENPEVIKEIQNVMGLSNEQEITQEVGKKRIVLHAQQRVETEAEAGINVKQSQASVTNVETHNTQQEATDGLLDRILELVFAKRIDLPRRWDDVQRTQTYQVSITLSANNILEYVTDVLAPILILQALASPTQATTSALPFFITSPLGLVVMIPGKLFAPFTLIESFSYTLDPIQSANTGHSLQATVQLSFANLLGAFVAPRTVYETVSSERDKVTHNIFNTAISAILGSVLADPVKVAVYRNNKWISNTDETKYSSEERLLYGDSLYYNTPKKSTASVPVTDTRATTTSTTTIATLPRAETTILPAKLDSDKIKLSANCEITIGQLRQTVQDVVDAYIDYKVKVFSEKLEQQGITGPTKYELVAEYDRLLRNKVRKPLIHETYLRTRTYIDTNIIPHTPTFIGAKDTAFYNILGNIGDNLEDAVIRLSRHESGYYRYDIGQVDKYDRGYMQVNLRYHGSYVKQITDVDPDIALRSDATLGAEVGYRVYMKNLYAHYKAYNANLDAYDVGRLALVHHRPAERNPNHIYAQKIREVGSVEYVYKKQIANSEGQIVTIYETINLDDPEVKQLRDYVLATATSQNCSDDSTEPT